MDEAPLYILVKGWSLMPTGVAKSGVLESTGIAAINKTTDTTTVSTVCTIDSKGVIKGNSPITVTIASASIPPYVMLEPVVVNLPFSKYSTTQGEKMHVGSAMLKIATGITMEAPPPISPSTIVADIYCIINPNQEFVTEN